MQESMMIVLEYHVLCYDYEPNERMSVGMSV